MTGLIAQFIACSWLFGWFYFINSVNGITLFAQQEHVCLLLVFSVTIVVSQFIIGTTVSLLTEPITLGSAVSLFSKKVAPDVQGRHA